MKSLIVFVFASLGACYNPDLGPTGTAGLYCHPDDTPACPDGSACMMQPDGTSRCISTMSTNTNGGGSIPTIPKSGAMSTPTQDPMLDSTSDCPDTALEPNDTISQAREFSITVDSTSTPKLVHLAICPKGANDIDVFAIPVPSANLYMEAELFYDVSYGDLDVAILDSSGNILSSDGSAVSNACTAVQLPAAGTYYVAIEGAGGQVNRYDARIRLFSTSHACGS